MFVKGMDGTVGMGHKKARRACAVRALRTSSDDSGNHRWRILVGWRSLNKIFNVLNIKVFFRIQLSVVYLNVYQLKDLRFRNLAPAETTNRLEFCYA